MDAIEQIIVLYKLFRGVREFDVSVFGTGDIGLEVENVYVKARKSSSGTRDDDVGKKIDRTEGASFGTNVSGVNDVITPNGHSHAVFFILVGFYLADDLGVGDLFLAVVWEIPEPYDVEGVGAFDTL